LCSCEQSSQRRAIRVVAYGLYFVKVEGEEARNGGDAYVKEPQFDDAPGFHSAFSL
jgi:hypothetical protein